MLRRRAAPLPPTPPRRPGRCRREAAVHGAGRGERRKHGLGEHGEPASDLDRGEFAEPVGSSVTPSTTVHRDPDETGRCPGGASVTYCSRCLRSRSARAAGMAWSHQGAGAVGGATECLFAREGHLVARLLHATQSFVRLVDPIAQRGPSSSSSSASCTLQPLHLEFAVADGCIQPLQHAARGDIRHLQRPAGSLVKACERCPKLRQRVQRMELDAHGWSSGLGRGGEGRSRVKVVLGQPRLVAAQEVGVLLRLVAVLAFLPDVGHLWR